MKRVLVVCLGLMATSEGCRSYKTITRTATWQCLPQLDRPDYPGVQTVRFNYTVNPHFFEIEPAQHLCDDLQRSDKVVVPLTIVVWNSRFGLGGAGYRFAAIDGKTYNATGGWGSSGFSGSAGSNDPGPDPLQ